jgi:dolichol-phosphate mannosyltransferase
MSQPELAVIVPTYNERENIRPLLDLLARALAGVSYEVVIVDDDSPDQTAAFAWTQTSAHPNVRVIQRINRRGLSSACVEGMMSTSAPYIAVIDADMQHDESVLPKMLAKIKVEALDIVIGSRHVEGGGMGEFSKARVWLSNMGKALSRAVCRADLSDPMSGFFVLDRRFLMEVVRSLSATGFKILLDILATARRPVKIGEVGYTFRTRQFGASKLDIVVFIEYAQLLLDKALGGLIPASYVVFCFIGALGFGLHISIVRLLIASAGWSFGQAQWMAGFVVMTVNFLLNNQLTFRSQRLRGWSLLPGYAVFCLACMVGLYLNVAVAESVRAASVWWLWASLAGLVVGSVWNYGVTSLFVWNVARRRLLKAEKAREQSVRP